LREYKDTNKHPLHNIGNYDIYNKYTFW